MSIPPFPPHVRIFRSLVCLLLSVAALCTLFREAGAQVMQSYVTAGGVVDDTALGIVRGADSSVYACGTYGGSIDFGGGVRLSGGTGFLAKFDAQLQALWATSFGASVSNVGLASDGGVIIAGGSTVTHYSPAGSLVWS